MIATLQTPISGYRHLLQQALIALTMIPRVSVWEWADRSRFLPTKGSGEPGPWRTSRVPYAQEIMDCLSDHHPCQRVVFKKSSQVSGTEIGLNWIGWFVDTQKAPMMCVQPTTDMTARFSKQRLEPMIEASPTLRAKIPPARSRDSGNTIELKEYPGGVIILAGANSSASLRSMPARYLFLDEVDAYPIDLNSEGDPVSLAEARTSTFPRRKVFLNSTPTIESLSRIHREYLASDQRRYYVPCPACGKKQPLIWDRLIYTPENPADAAYRCEQCDVLIAEHHKTALLAAGEWIAAYPERPTPGFHINALYSPQNLGLTWAELAAEYERKKNDPTQYKAFVNTRLGECFADPDEKLDWEELKGRAEPTPVRLIPAGCLLLTAGVDLQKDRFAVIILGHGRGGVVWVIDYVELPADPTRPADWAILDEALNSPFPDAHGHDYRITATAIDSAYLPDDVLNFTRRRRGKTIAVRGATTAGKPIISKPSKVDFTWKGNVIKQGAEQWQIGTDTAKHHLFARLAGDRKLLPQDRLVHFPTGLDDSFYGMLTAEIWDSTKRRWVKIRPRNEALDTFGYALAAAMQPALRVNTWREPQWAKWEGGLGLHRDLFSAPHVRETPAPSPSPAPELKPPPVSLPPPPSPSPTVRRQTVTRRFSL